MVRLAPVARSPGHRSPADSVRVARRVSKSVEVCRSPPRAGGYIEVEVPTAGTSWSNKAPAACPHRALGELRYHQAQPRSFIGRLQREAAGIDLGDQGGYWGPAGRVRSHCLSHSGNEQVRLRQLRQSPRDSEPVSA